MIVPKTFKPVRVDTDGSPSNLMIATALSVLMTASVAQEWLTNPDAEWAAMEGLDRVARGVGFRFVVDNDADATHVDKIPAETAPEAGA